MNDHERFADAAAASGWVLWFTSHALQWMPVVQFVSLLAAMAASIAATLYYIKKAGK
jgi:hypothetical protein